MKKQLEFLGKANKKHDWKTFFMNEQLIQVMASGDLRAGTSRPGSGGCSISARSTRDLLSLGSHTTHAKNVLVGTEEMEKP